MPVARIDEYKTKNFAAITNSFTTVGIPFAHNLRIWRIVNNTNGDMIFSVDGTTNHLFVPQNSFVLYDITANTDTDASSALVMVLNTQFYVKYSTAPTSGDVYIEGIYQRGQ